MIGKILMALFVLFVLVFAIGSVIKEPYKGDVLPCSKSDTSNHIYYDPNRH